MKAGTHGGKRPGAGRLFSPWRRLWLARRYDALERKFRNAGKRAPGTLALLAVRAKDGRHSDLETIGRLIVTGRQEENYLDDLGAKLHNGEPLDDLDRKILRDFSRGRRRRQERRRHRRET